MSSNSSPSSSPREYTELNNVECHDSDSFDLPPNDGAGMEDGDLGVDPKVSDEDDEKIFTDFVKANDRIGSNDSRSANVRNKLWKNLELMLRNKYTVDELQLKLMDVKGEWRSADIDEVIDFHRQYPELWNCSLPDHHNKPRINILLKSLANIIGNRKTAAEIQKKFANLKKTFANMSKSGKTGDGAKKGRPWPYYQALIFLRGVPTQRQTYDSVTQNIQRPDEVLLDNDDIPMLPRKTSTLGTDPAGTPARKHMRYNGVTSQEMFHKKVLDTLQTNQTGSEAFGVSVAHGLSKLSDENQEFVKIQIQLVLPESLRCQGKGMEMPTFTMNI